MTTLKTLQIALLAAGFALGAANAQTGTDTSATASTTTNTTRTDDGRGFDYGWLGLIGLVGLLGLRRPNVVADTRTGTTNRL